MKVLVLSDLWLPFPGGAERLMFNLSRELLRRGHDVHAFTGYENPLPFDGPAVQRSDVPLDRRGWAIIEQQIERVRPQVIIAHHLYASTFARQLVELHVPLVHVVLNGQRLPGADLGVHISRWVAERADAAHGDLIVHPPAYEDVVADSHQHAVGFIKPIPHKGVALVYEIARRLPERRFVILRGEWQTLEVLAELPNVRYVEPLADIRDFYRLVDVVLVPSISEDAGTVAQECTLNGIPCVSSDAGGLAETNAGGVIIRSRASLLWANAVKRLDRMEVRSRVVRSMRAVLDVHAAEVEAFVECVEALA